MNKKKSFLTATDIFCGCGGSSQGARQAGVEIKLAMNHWPLAIKSHAANFPETEHDCADASGCNPRNYDSTDILIISPECTRHTLARAGKKKKKQLNMFETEQMADDRSRATMWDVPRFAEAHRYLLIITENVVDAKGRWEPYEAWLKSMDLLGYNYQECYFNSMHFHPTPQSRDRLYVVFWRKGNKAPNLNFEPLAWCSNCSKNINAFQYWKPKCLPYGKYRTQYLYKCTCGTSVEPYYYAAFNCIDWSIKSTRIGDMKKPLVDATLKRIGIGIAKYWNNPFVIYGGDQKLADRCYSLGNALPTQCAQPWHQLITPFISYASNNHGDPASRNSDTREPLNTQTTTQDAGITMPPLPFISSGQYGGQHRAVTDRADTFSTEQTFDLVTPPFTIELFGTGGARGLEEPINTQLSGGVHNGIVSTGAWNSFIGHYYKGAHEKHFTETIGTCSTTDRSYLVQHQAGKKVSVDDCYYRMIRSKEVGAAMAFEKSYIVYGDERQRVKQFGNAVTPPVMKFLIERCIESLN